MPKGALFNCKSLQKVLVAEGCTVDVKNRVGPRVSVETVVPERPVGGDELSSSSVQIEVEDEEALRKKLEEKD